MTDAYVGQATTRELRIEDTGGVPVVDATVTYTLYSPAARAALVTAQPAPHTGDGWYSYSLPGSLLTVPGWYEETWDGSSSGNALPTYTGFQVEYTHGPVVARWEVRHLAARLNHDLWTGSASSGTTTTLVDAERTLEPDDHWRGAWLTLYGGTGRGQERRVSASRQSTGTLTVANPWSPAPAAATRYELHKLFGGEDYNAAINAALDALQGHYWVPMTDESLAVSDAGVYEYVLPAEMEWVRAVYYLDTTTTDVDWRRIRAQINDYDLVRGRHVLRLTHPIADTRLRIVGDRPPPRLERDGAFAPVNATYLAHAANALLWQSLVTSPGLDTKAAAVRAKQFTDQANALLPQQRPGKGARRV
jgi:hypothetical protein